MNASSLQHNYRIQIILENRILNSRHNLERNEMVRLVNEIAERYSRANRNVDVVVYQHGNSQEPILVVNSND